jgi:hypothetical protein
MMGSQAGCSDAPALSGPIIELSSIRMCQREKLSVLSWLRLLIVRANAKSISETSSTQP